MEQGASLGTGPDWPSAGSWLSHGLWLVAGSGGPTEGHPGLCGLPTLFLWQQDVSTVMRMAQGLKQAQRCMAGASSSFWLRHRMKSTFVFYVPTFGLPHASWIFHISVAVACFSVNMYFAIELLAVFQATVCGSMNKYKQGYQKYI